MYVRVLRTYDRTHNVPNTVVYGSHRTSTELYKISAILSSMRVSSKRCRPSKLTLPSFGDSLSTLDALTVRKVSDTDAVTARRSLQRPLLGGRKSTSLCDKWQAKQRQERQARDNAGYLPSYSEAVQKKITEVGIQHISQDESRSFAYDAAAAVIAGGRPFSLFESRRWRYFFTRIKPGWKPPSRAVITRILPEFYQEIYDEVFKHITSSEWFNIIFDASDNVSGHRIVNISVQVPDGPAFYWKSLDTGDEQHTAENWVRLI
jgi:hypothetical protein